jgi:DNA-binding phage protein
MGCVDPGGATYRKWNVYEDLDCEESLCGFLYDAHAEDAASVIRSLGIVAVARFINQAAPAAGVDRKRLCAAFAGHAALDGADAAKLLASFGAPVPSESPVAVG